MKKKMTTVAFNGTAEQLAKLDELIAKHKGEKGALMPILQGAQGICFCRTQPSRDFREYLRRQFCRF